MFFIYYFDFFLKKKNVGENLLCIIEGIILYVIKGLI